MHPTGPYGRAGTHTRCHCGGPSGGFPVLSVRSHHTTMQRARSRGGWTMSQARPRQHADGRLVSTRSCWCTLARVATAAARVASKALLLHSGGAAAGVARHNPIPVRPPVGWRGAAVRATAAAQHAASGAQGSQGVCRNSHLAASGGRVDELLCHCGGTAAPLRRRRQVWSDSSNRGARSCAWRPYVHSDAPAAGQTPTGNGRLRVVPKARANRHRYRPSACGQAATG